MSSVYGINNISYEKGAPKAAREIVDHEEIQLLPGGYSTQYIPFIHLLPSLIPFCGLSQITKEVRRTTDELRESCFQVAMEAWVSVIIYWMKLDISITLLLYLEIRQSVFIDRRTCAAEYG